MEFNIRLCGEAGQGLQTIGKILLDGLARQGWELFAHQEYESIIRGGNSYFQVALSDKPLTCHVAQPDLLVAMSAQSWQQFSPDLAADGVGIHPGPQNDGEGLVLDASAMAAEHGSAKMASAVVAGIVWSVVGAPLEGLEQQLAEVFASLGQEMIENNKKAAAAGYDWAEQKELNRKLSAPRSPRPRMLLRGNDAVALGAMAAGLKFISAYPMTPATSIVEFIAAQAADAGIRVEQAEDEIAAINMALGAGYAGVRAMTATSGGGFALMVEALSLAGSAEVPVVVVNGQRPGPSTGMPTRTEQGDLLFVLHGGHGDFPRAVLAPGSVEEAFYLMPHAFNLAEKYQTPVIVLTDQYLADCFVTVEPLDTGNIAIDRGKEGKPTADYRRYKITEDGISPLVRPGSEPAVVVAAGDEHDEEGHLTEDGATRVAMMDKRMTKAKGLEAEALEPVAVGSKSAQLVLLTWGSTWGVVRRAVEELNGKGVAVRALHLPQLWPLPKEKLIEELGDAAFYTVENNYAGQLARLLAMEGMAAKGSITRYDGRQLDVPRVIQAVEEVLK